MPHPKGGHTRLSDIAGEAGVSISLVSRILSGNMGNVSAQPEIIERVKRIAKELHYTPDRRARSLRTGKNYTVGVLLPMGSNFTTSVYPQVLQGIADGAAGSGYDLMFQYYFGTRDELRGLRAVRRMHIDGLIYAPDPAQPLTAPIHHLLCEMLQGGMPIVFCMERYDLPGTYSFAVDDLLGVRMSVEHLIGRGHRDILYLYYLMEQRRNHFLALAKRHRVQVTVFPCHSFREQDGYQAMSGYLQEGKAPPRAIAAISDVTAIGALRAMRECGIDTGALDVVGYDYMDYMKLLHIPIASVKQPAYEVGLLCARGMVDLLQGRTIASQKLPPVWVDRPSPPSSS